MTGKHKSKDNKDAQKVKDVGMKKAKDGKKEIKEKKEKKEKGKKEEKGSGSTTKKKERKEVISLSVAVYQPEDGNLHHWALYLEPHNYVYQVTGEAMDFTASVTTDTIPSRSGRFVETVEVADIQPNDLSELDRIIRETPVQNDVQGWCCQDYVLDALELLNDEQIVDDEDYERARRRLLRRFNH
jgi:hypothetical protein